MEDQPQVMNYDPNLCNSGNMAKQRVRLTFGLWEYRKVIEIEQGGNCKGLTVIEAAVENVYAELEGGDTPRIELVSADGSTLECEDDEDRGEDWLQDMLIAAEIVSIQPDEAATRRWRGG